jgi:C4-type Zn-finger protein
MKLAELRDRYSPLKFPPLDLGKVAQDRREFINRLRCPNCGSDEYKFFPGAQDYMGPKLEPDFGHCESCGFEYSEYVNSTVHEQVRLFRQMIDETMINGEGYF